MEQVGTGFVQVVPSFSDFHRSVGRQVRRGLTEAGTQGGRDMGRAVSRGFSGALGGVGTALNRTGQQIARAASSIRPVDRAVRGLSAGLRGTYLETTGAAGALNSMGLAAQVAVTMARDGSRLLSAGLHGVGVSASESGTRMYRLGNTASGVFQGAARGARAVSDGVRGLGASVSGWVRDARSEVTGLGGALTRMGAVGAAAIAALGFGALAVDVARVASSAQTTEASLLALYGAAGGGAKEVNDLMAEMDVRFAHLDLSVMREGATSLAYMGVQGKAAVEILENLEAATTASGTGAEGMSRAFAAMTSGVNAGAFQMDTLNQISDAGIPIYDALSDVLGVDIPEAQKMASDGAIGLEEVLQALDGEHGTWFPALIEGAENVGNTFSGAWSTIKNTVVNGLASEVVPLVDKLTPTMLGVASAISSGFDRLPGLLSDIKSHLSDAGIIDGFLGLVSGARELVTALAPAALTFAQTFLPALASVLLVLDPLGKALQITAGWMRENEEVVKLLGVGLGAATAAIVAIAVAKGVWAAVTWGLAAAINATGIPLLIIGIAALIAGVIYAYKNFDGFRERVDAAAGAIKGAASAIWQKGLKPAFDALRHGLSLIGDGATWLWENALGPALGGIMGGFRGAGEAALWLWEKGISPAWDAISFGARLLFTVISTVLITPLYLAFQLVAATATWLWQNAFQPAWEGIAAGATWLWTSALQPTWQAAQAALSLLGAAFTWLWSAAAQPVLAFLSTGVQEWWKTTRAAFSAAVSFIRGVLAAVFTWLRDKVVRPVFSALSSTISGGARAWRSSLDAIRSWIRGTLGPVFTWLRDSVVTPVMNGIRSVISSVWQNGIRPSFEALRNGVDRVKRSFELARDGIRTAWNQLRSITRKPVEFIVNSVYNRGIRRVWNSVADLVDMKNLPSYSFDRGGIMPGYTPGRDVHLFASPTGGLLELSGGEAIMRPEWTRAVGPQFIDMMNSAARNGGISRVRSMMAGAPIRHSPAVASSAASPASLRVSPPFSTATASLDQPAGHSNPLSAPCEAASPKATGQRPWSASLRR